MKRAPKLNIAPADIEAGQQLHSALMQVRDLPEDSQWEMALELLPDAFLLNVVRANSRKGDEMLNLLGLLSGVAVEDLTGERADENTLTASLYGLIFSCLAELEKRHHQFSVNVVQMDYPFAYDPESPIGIVPKDPETYSIEKLFEYYRSPEASGE